MGFPATTFEEAVELTITASNQHHQIINGSATEQVQVEDGSYIPTVRKALVDNLYFKSPIAWSTGTNETIFNQLRSFPDPISGQISWWYAPNATNSNPILMPSNPTDSPNWVIYGLTNNALYQVQKRLAAEAGFNLVGTFFLGCTLSNATKVILDEFSGKYYSWSGTFPKNVPAGADPTVAGSGYVPRADVTLRGELASESGSGLVGYQPASTGAVATTVQSKLGETVSIKDFGAVGDGTTDDTAAIQAAIAAVPYYGGQIHFPKGTYLISSTLALPEFVNIKLTGEGNSSSNNGYSATTIKKASTLNGEAIVLNTDGSSIERLTVQGVSGNGGDGILINASRCTLRDVSVFLMGNDGIRIGVDSPSTYNCNLWLLENCKTKNNGRHGVCISEGAGDLADANAGTCLHLDTQANTASGLCLNGTQLGTYVGGAYQNNGKYGIHLTQYAKYNTFIGSDIEANVVSQFRIEAGSQWNYIQCYTMYFSMMSISTTTEQNRIEVIDHNRVISGIKFPPAQVASTEANTLDDYEEGVFTPVLRDDNGGNAATAVTTIGRYTKIGKQVFFNISLISITTTGLTDTSQIVITGLPFASVNIALNNSHIAKVLKSNVSSITGSVAAYIGNNASHMTLLNDTTTGLLSLTVNSITSGSGSLYVSGNYEAAS